MTTRLDSAFFDLDGTLVDTAPDLIAALNQLLSEKGYPVADPIALRAHVSAGAKGILWAGLGNAANDALIEALRPRYLALYQQTLCQHSQPFPGMLDVLADLDARGQPWGIVTNKPAYLSEPLLDALQLRSRSCALVCGDTLPRQKPHPDPLLHACEQCGLAPESSVYIGDDKRDILAGNAAGMRTLGARWGYYREEDCIDDWPCEQVIDTPLALRGWLADASTP